MSRRRPSLTNAGDARNQIGDPQIWGKLATTQGLEPLKYTGDQYAIIWHDQHLWRINAGSKLSESAFKAVE